MTPLEKLLIIYSGILTVWALVAIFWSGPTTDKEEKNHV